MLKIRSHPSETADMPTEKKFGVVCKNPQCGEWIVLGTYVIPPDPKSSLRNFVWTGPWKLICPTCGDIRNYDETNLREILGSKA